MRYGSVQRDLQRALARNWYNTDRIIECKCNSLASYMLQFSTEIVTEDNILARYRYRYNTDRFIECNSLARYRFSTERVTEGNNLATE